MSVFSNSFKNNRRKSVLYKTTSKVADMNIKKSIIEEEKSNSEGEEENDDEKVVRAMENRIEANDEVIKIM